MPSRTPPPQFITVPPPPRTSTRRWQRASSFLARSATAWVVLTVAFPMVAGVSGLLADQTDPLGRTNCFPRPLAKPITTDQRDLAIAASVVMLALGFDDPQIRAVLREIMDLNRTEAEIRATLPRSQPGLIVPRMEDYR